MDDQTGVLFLKDLEKRTFSFLHQQSNSPDVTATLRLLLHIPTPLCSSENSEFTKYVSGYAYFLRTISSAYPSGCGFYINSYGNMNLKSLLRRAKWIPNYYLSLVIVSFPNYCFQVKLVSLCLLTQM